MFNVFDHRRFFLQQFYTRGIHFLLYVDVKIWATKGDQRARQHVYWTLTAHGNKKANSVEESLEDCRDLATNRKHVTNRTGSKRKPSTSAWQKDTLFAECLTIFVHTSCRFVDLYSSSTGIFLCRIGWFLYQCQSDPLRSSVGLWSCSRSTSAFGKNPLLSRRTWKAHSPLQRSTAFGCLFKLKRTYVYVQYHGTAGSGEMSLKWNEN